MKKFLEKYNILKNEKVIIACSGWVDSMFLLSEIIKSKNKKDIIVAHFNHKLRLEESDLDEEFVKEFCEKNNLVFEVKDEDISQIALAKKIWIEEAARIERYKFLRNIKEKYWAKYILVAHHLDDKIETFLLNLIRWTKLKWLISIEEKNEDILRPLLPFSKSEIIEKAKKLWLKWREDKSNLDEKYLRNNIRLNILPLFDQINSSYKKSFENIMSYMWEIKTYFDEQIKKIIINNEYFEIETFNNFPEFLQREVIRYVFEITNFWTIGLSEGNIKEVIKFINDKWNYTKKEIKKMSLFKKNWKIYLM